MSAHYRFDWGYESFGMPRIDDAVLTVGDGRVVSLRPAAQTDPAVLADALRMPGSGVVPGLIDAHVHLHFDGGDDPVAALRAADDDTLASLATRNARALLSAGITTARDLGSRGASVQRLAAAIADGHLVGPRLLTAGSPLTPPGGHTWYLGGEISEIAQVGPRIAALAEAGAQWVKIMVSGGFLTESTSVATPNFAVDDVRRIVEVAAAHGMRVAAHAHSTLAVLAAAAGGVHTIEHATFISPDGIDFTEDVADRILASGVAVCPTANVATASYPAAYGDEAIGRLAGLHARGLVVAMGTDAGVAHVAGDAYVEGLAALVRGGFAIGDALGAATTGAARALALPDAGHLAPGARADAVIVRADPTHSLDALRAPAAVMAAGRVHTREELAA